MQRVIGRRLWALAMGLALAGAVLGGAELVLRLVREDTSDFEYLIRAPYWRLKRSHVLGEPELTGGRSICTDRNGLRVARPGEEAPADARVGLLGASNLFGFRLDYEKTLAGLLEQRLGEPVLNLSAIGYDSAQGLRCLEQNLERGIGRRLRVLVVSFGVNDVGHSPDWITHGLVNRLVWSGYARSYAAWYFVSRHYFAWVRRRSREYQPRVGLEAFRRNIEGIAAVCRAAGITPLFMPDPVPYHARIRTFRPRVMSWHPRLLSALNEGDRHDRLYRCAVEAGLQRWFPSCDPEKVIWLEYEAALLGRAETFDINRELERRLGGGDPRPAFLPGYVAPGVPEPYPDHTHLSGEGWRLVVGPLSRKIAGLLGEAAPGGAAAVGK
jgi:lysophospholipase L1-like esterase